jgi:peroxin-14
VEDSLKEIKEGTNAALTNMSEQSKKVDDSINSLSQVLEELEKNDKERDSDFNDMKREIDTLQTTVSKVCHQAK